MTDKPHRHDLRDSLRTEESRAAEKKVGETPFENGQPRPQDPPADAPSPPTKE